MKHVSRPVVCVVAFVALLAVGCGVMVDKDRIRIAQIGDDFITRGDLKRHIRELPDEERPAIRNKGDVIKALNAMINARLKRRLADDMRRAGEIDPQPDLARMVYFQKHPDQAPILELESGAPMDLTDAQLEGLKQEVLLGIEEQEKDIQADMALAQYASQKLETGELKITDEEFEQQYALLKDQLKKPERVAFLALRFPAAPNAEQMAASARRSIDEGTPFETIAQALHERNPQFVLNSELENHPGSNSFRTFWASVSGAEVGDIIGPIFVPGYEQHREDGSSAGYVPEAFMIVKVLERDPAITKTLEEAKPDLVPIIAMSKGMDLLRDEHNVEVHRAKVADPEGYSVAEEKLY